MQSHLTPAKLRPVLEYVPIVKRFPKCYQQFLEDLKRPRTPVNYRAAEKKFSYDASKEKILPVKEKPIPSIFPPESQTGLWAGEGIVMGYREAKKTKHVKPWMYKTICKMWIPKVYSTVLYSEILDKYLKVRGGWI